MDLRQKRTWLVIGVGTLVAICCICPMLSSMLRGRAPPDGAFSATPPTRSVAQPPSRTVALPTLVPQYTLPLLEAIALGQVKAQAYGAGLDSVELVLERLTSEPLAVVVPVGTFFSNHGSARQDMVVVQRATAHLTDQDVVTTTVRAACANLRRRVPDRSSTFEIRLLPESESLQQLMAAIEQGEYAHTVKQIAVWIVTDDVSRSTLDYRYRRSVFGSPFVSSPAATDEDVIRALWLVQQAGLALKDKTLYAERVSLVRALSAADAEVYTWAQESLRVAPDAVSSYLVSLLGEENADLREAAALTLGGRHDLAAVEPLILHLQDTDERVRAATAQALGDIGDQRAVEPLRAALETEKESSVRAKIEYALRRLE